MAIKHKTKYDFETKTFQLGVNFKVKEMEDSSETEDEVITIEGYANFSGDCDDTSSCFIDRTNDVVVPTGIEIASYKKSPVVLFQHNRDYVIGKALTVTKKKDGLFIKAEIHQGAMEEEDFYAIKNGLYTSFSIGFRTKAGEFKDVNGTDVFFITKSELLEVSVVSIPCNTNSTFNLIKSFEGNIYAGDFDLSPSKNSASVEVNKSVGEDTMKIKLRDIISGDKVKEIEDLGLGESLDELREVDTKTFVEALVSKEVQAAVAASLELIRNELKQSAESEVEVKSEEEKPASEEETSTEDESATEEKADEEVEEKDVDVEVFKSMSDDIAKLTALATAE